MKTYTALAQIKDVSKALETVQKVEHSIAYSLDENEIKFVREKLGVELCDIADVRMQLSTVLSKMQEKFDNCELLGWEE